MLFICFSDLNIFFREVGGFISLAKLSICKNYTHIRSYKLHVTRFEKVPSLRVSSAQGHTKLRVTFEGFILRHGSSFVNVKSSQLRIPPPSLPFLTHTQKYFAQKASKMITKQVKEEELFGTLHSFKSFKGKTCVQKPDKNLWGEKNKKCAVSNS